MDVVADTLANSYILKGSTLAIHTPATRKRSVDIAAALNAPYQIALDKIMAVQAAEAAHKRSVLNSDDLHESDLVKSSAGLSLGGLAGGIVLGLCQIIGLLLTL
eukprot:TRINITY_DN2111_c0_g1_i10.p3 TRINITY_DN2111_c0_g1~~TRINITY_DN2111_c0_g1_i10.p3  ORF type:complete len:104 (+),score=8.41 TRINITY_DN2111_c0_g1_i10:1048-1359(+)